jgi:Ca-activated chloride channel family protein
LPFPSTVKTIDAILFAYLNEARPPADATFVLDTSGSMADQDKLGHLQAALRGLAGLDTSLTGRFSVFHRRERLTFITFSDTIAPAQDFVVPVTGASSPVLQQIRSFVNGLQAGGGTAIYSALIAAYKRAEQQQAHDPTRYYSIVLMTDGQNNNGAGVEEFLSFYDSLPARAKGIRTFTVLFGDASPDELNQIADKTGGKVFDARSTSLSSVFKEIRGYQ